MAPYRNTGTASQGGTQHPELGPGARGEGERPGQQPEVLPERIEQRAALFGQHVPGHMSGAPDADRGSDERQADPGDDERDRGGDGNRVSEMAADAERVEPAGKDQGQEDCQASLSRDVVAVPHRQPGEHGETSDAAYRKGQVPVPARDPPDQTR